MKKTYQGGCHCGAVRFEADVDLSAGTIRCNCGFCRKARWWMTFVKAADFRLVKADTLTDYQYTPGDKPGPFLHLQFCSKCGVRAFTKGGELPQFGSEFYAVNVVCLDGVTDEELTSAPVKFADGRHDRWDQTPAITGYL
jgi:hypothetical protein